MVLNWKSPAVFWRWPQMRLANLAPTCSARSHGKVLCITVSISLFSWVCPSDCQLRSWLSNNIYVYFFIGTLGKTKIPTTAAGNQTGPQGINNTGDPLYGCWLGSNQTPLHYPVMLNPYPTFQNPVPGVSDHLQFEPDRDSASPSPSESLNRSDDSHSGLCIDAWKRKEKKNLHWFIDQFFLFFCALTKLSFE